MYLMCRHDMIQLALMFPWNGIVISWDECVSRNICVCEHRSVCIKSFPVIMLYLSEFFIRMISMRIIFPTRIVILLIPLILVFHVRIRTDLSDIVNRIGGASFEERKKMWYFLRMLYLCYTEYGKADR